MNPYETPTKLQASADANECSNNNMLFDCLALPPQVRDVNLPRTCSFNNPFALCRVIDNVLTPQECQAIIARATAKGFERALLNIGGGRQIYAPDTRNSERVIIDDKVFAKRIHDRISHLLPSNHTSNKTTYPTVDLNERIRILRYQPGQDFKPHCDGSYFRPGGSQGSFWTVMIYLNNGGGADFEGGATLFHARDASNQTTTVVPQAGSVLVFDHNLYHEGEKVRSGTKYAIRTDMMFQTLF